MYEMFILLLDKWLMKFLVKINKQFMDSTA